VWSWAGLSLKYLTLFSDLVCLQAQREFVVSIVQIHRPSRCAVAHGHG
jgi:hypothetical protein